MKILWLTWKDRDHPQAGGAEVVNDELAQRLTADGHDVVFFTAGFPGAKRNLTRHGFRIVRLGGRLTTYLAAPLEYLKRWRGWPDLVIDECNTLPYFASIYTQGRQVLFFHMLCRQIWFYQAPQPISTLGYLLEPLYLRLLRRNLPVITVSESTRQDLIRTGYNPANIRIIPEAISTEPVADLDTATKYSQPTLLSLGSIRAMKRTLHQIQAFELAKRHIPNLRLLVAGDSSGTYGKKVLEYISQSAYTSDIEYLGPVTEAKKRELMQKSHAILVTSVKEGWGLIVTEAASQGTPAVVYNVDGLRDSVRHNQTGLVTRTNTPAALADNIALLLSQPDQYAHMRASGWEWSNTLTFDHSYAQFKEALGL
jgi:glycosyltransferase involved in cell wall biosynthesis